MTDRCAAGKAGVHAAHALVSGTVIALALLALPVREALAHAGERAYVLLLPTRLYIIGGTLIVVLSFALVVWIPRRWSVTSAAVPQPDARAPAWPAVATLLLLTALVAAGYLGSRDPLANPLPTTVWSLWWVGITLLHAVFGNLWGSLNPLRALRHLAALTPAALRLPYPTSLAYWPAVLGYSCFAWFELVYPAPQDPAALAHAIVIYLVVSLCGMSVFGAREWLQFADPFGVFFRMVGWLSPLAFSCNERGKPRLVLRWPCSALLHVERLPVSGVVFVLLVLASVSFDGLSRSFWWLDLLGENPLEYPGRTALMVANSLGMCATFLVFAVAYTVTVRTTAWLSRASRETTFAVFVLSIVPIAFGYHFAHYLPAFLVDAQYAMRALADPLARGWDLLGTAQLHVTASFLAHHASVEIIWHLQIAAIVAAHVCAVVVAHLFALRHSGDRRLLVRGQLPALALMMGYTWFGLWLLSTPISA